MKLDVEVDGLKLEPRAWLVLSVRQIVELSVEILDERPRLAADMKLSLSLGGRPLPYEVTTPKVTPPGVNVLKTVRIRPLVAATWREKKMLIQVSDAKDAGAIAKLELSVIPAPQARAAMLAFFACAAVGLLIAWPAFLAEPANLWERACKVVFGAPALMLFLDAVTKRVKDALTGSSAPSELGAWSLFGLKPTLSGHLALGLISVALVAVLTRQFVVMYTNTSGHELTLRWNGREVEPLPANATTSRLTRSAATLFQSALKDQPSTLKRRHCLAGLEADCPLRAESVRFWELPFAASRAIDVRCREVTWPAIHPSSIQLGSPIGLKLSGERVTLDTGREDCAPVSASISVDANLADGMPPQAVSPKREYRFSFDEESNQHLPALDEFVVLRVMNDRDTHTGAGPIVIQSLGKGTRDFLGTRWELSATSSAKSAEENNTPTVRIPAPVGTYRFELSIGPTTDLSWGTLTCFPRGAREIELWLLTLEDSAVMSFRVEGTTGVISSWTASVSGAGEPNRVVPICLPRSQPNPTGQPAALAASSARPHIEVSVDARMGIFEAPQLVLPRALANSVIAVASGSPGSAQHLGIATCNYPGEHAVRLLRASGLRSPARTADPHFELYAPLERTECQTLRQVPKENTKITASWSGQASPLVCVEEPPTKDACYPVKPSWGNFTCGFAPATPSTQCAGPAARVCQLDRQGQQRTGKCPHPTVSAKSWLTLKEQQDISRQGCDPDIAQVCL